MKHEEVVREVDNLLHKKGRRRGIGISKKTGIGIFAVMIAATLIASGALLSYYGKMEVTATVDQSVVTSTDGGTWVNFDTPITRDLGNVVSCNDYTYKAWIWNRACTEANVEIINECTLSPVVSGGEWDDEGFDITHYIIGDPQTIKLLQKEVVFGTSPWVEVIGGAYADLTFNTCNKWFTYKIKYSGLTIGMDYSLIYYANLPEYWEEGPVTILRTFTANVLGVAMGTNTGTPTMPYIDDENAQRPIGDLNEEYLHQYGAKFWIVPTNAINDGDVNWAMASDFLFETDLGLYIDCDDLTPIWIPLVYDEFDTTILQPESTYCWLTCYHMDLNIWPGIYKFDTYLNPV